MSEQKDINSCLADVLLLYGKRSLCDLAEEKYRVWYKKKRGKKPRKIEEPSKDLKEFQKLLISSVLNYSFGDQVQGGVCARSTRTNALIHVGSEYLLRIDLRKAYPSVSSGMVYNLFRDDGLFHDNAKMLVGLTTFHDYLPHGAPTSCYIFNHLLETKVDKKIVESLKGTCIKYTRYIDDMIFTSEQPLPKLNYIEEIITRAGLYVNHDKTIKYSTKHRPLQITGVNIINGKPKVPPKLIRKLRGMICRATFTDSVNKKQVFGIIAFVIGIERKIPNQILRPFLGYVKVRRITKTPFTTGKRRKRNI